MPVIDQSARISLVQAFLGAPVALAYGRCWVAGNRVLQEEDANKNRYIAHLLGEGPWKGPKKLWVNRKVFDHTNTAIAHFHPGRDGAIGAAMTPASNGGDQLVDNFFSSLGGLSTVTWSRSAYQFLKVAPDPGAPSADIEFVGDYECLLVRQYNSSGALTTYDYSENPAWWTHDLVLRKWFLRGQRIDRPLNAAERARFAWSSWSETASWCDEMLGGGQKRWSQGGAPFADERSLQQALDQLLVRCLSSLREDGGQIILDPTGKRRGYVFTFNAGNARGFRLNKDNLRSAKNEYSLGFANLDVASGDSGQGETRFAPETVTVKHKVHQRAIGTRGPGLAVQSQSEEVTLDLGTATRELGHRIARSLQLAELGLDVEDQRDYLAPFEAQWESSEAALRVTPGDVVRIDRSLWMDTRSRGKRRYLNTATRIQTSGGSIVEKYTHNGFGASPNGVRCETRVCVSNIGSKTVRVTDHLGGAAQDVQPGETRFLEFANVGNGINAWQISFMTTVVGDSLDFVAYLPSMRRMDTGAEVLPAADADFEGGGWITEGGATVTVTQGENLQEWPLLVEVLDSSAGAGEEGGGDIFLFGGREYNPFALEDAAPTQQQAEAPDPGTGLRIVSGAGNHSYRPLVNPLRARDVGSNVTVDVGQPTAYSGAWLMEVAQVGQISNNAGAVSSLAYSTLYFISHKDPNLAGGAVTYEAFSTKSAALAEGRFFDGSIFTPPAGGVNTFGRNDGGVGAQIGSSQFFSPGTLVEANVGASFSNPNACRDGDTSTKTTATIAAAGTFQRAQIHLRNFPATQKAWSALFLNARYAIPTNNLNGGGAFTRFEIRYTLTGQALNYGSGGTLWVSKTAGETVSPTELTPIALSPTQNLGLVEVMIAVVTGVGDTGGSIVADQYEAWINGEE